MSSPFRRRRRRPTSAAGAALCRARSACHRRAQPDSTRQASGWQPQVGQPPRPVSAANARRAHPALPNIFCVDFGRGGPGAVKGGVGVLGRRRPVTKARRRRGTTSGGGVGKASAFPGCDGRKRRFAHIALRGETHRIRSSCTQSVIKQTTVVVTVGRTVISGTTMAQSLGTNAPRIL